jgi:ABC-type multidrug transport system fused ATPase/permease subunit
MLFISGYEDE